MQSIWRAKGSPALVSHIWCKVGYTNNIPDMPQPWPANCKETVCDESGDTRYCELVNPHAFSLLLSLTNLESLWVIMIRNNQASFLHPQIQTCLLVRWERTTEVLTDKQKNVQDIADGKSKQDCLRCWSCPPSVATFASNSAWLCHISTIGIIGWLVWAITKPDKRNTTQIIKQKQSGRGVQHEMERRGKHHNKPTICKSKEFCCCCTGNNVPVNAEPGICRYAKDITSESKLLYVKKFPWSDTELHKMACNRYILRDFLTYNHSIPNATSFV